MKRIEELRESLRANQVSFGISSGWVAGAVVAYHAEIQPPTTCATTIFVSLGIAAFTGMKSHNLGQEIAARQAVIDQQVAIPDLQVE